MSSSAQPQQAREPEILGVDELKTEAKWLKMEKIRWRDQEGKEVSRRFSCSAAIPPIRPRKPDNQVFTCAGGAVVLCRVNLEV